MKICQYLVGHGFFSALNTVEFPGGIQQVVGYNPAQEKRAGSNNGVVVVYDEVGCPWVRSKPITADERDWLLDHDVVFKGAYVPHSNGGDWLEMMERLRDENAYTRMMSETVS